MNQNVATKAENVAEQLPARIALIAGQGDFPGLIADAARSNGVEVTIFALKGFARADVETKADKIFWLELGQVGRAIELLHNEGISDLTMAGRVPHNSIFQYKHFDLRAMKLIARVANKRADGLLTAVANEFLKEGIRVLDSSLFLKSMMPRDGMISTGRRLTNEEIADVKFGFPIAKVVAGQDIGQTIVVKSGMVVAVEGTEGTDDCVRRAGHLVGPGCVVIKVSKPRQDLRFDIPIIGPQTIMSLAGVGATALALSSGDSLVFHRDQIDALSRESNIAVIAVSEKLMETDSW